MITSINYKSGATSFKAVPKFTRPENIAGDLKFGTSRQLNSIKEAVKEILSPKSNIVAQKVKAVADSFNITIDKGIKFASLLGVSSAVNLFIKKSEAQELGIEVQAKDSKNAIFYIEGSKVSTIKNKKKHYLTAQEIKALNLETLLAEISNSVDFPLLKLRQAQLPKVEPYIPIYPAIKPEETPQEEKNILAETTNEEQPLETVFIFKDEIKKCRKINCEPSEKYDTSEEVDILLRKLKTNPNIKTTSLSTTNASLKDIGRIPQATLDLIKEVNNLFSLIDSVYEKEDQLMLKKIRKNMKQFSSYRKGSTITFNNLDENQSGLTLVKSYSKKHQGHDITAVYKRDKDGNIIDIIPISNDKVYRMIDSFTLDKASSFVNFVSIKKCLDQEEINSKDLHTLFSTLKSLLEEVLLSVDSTEGTLSDRTLTLISQIENKRKKLKTKEDSLKGAPNRSYQTLRSGGMFFRGINNEGDNLIYVNPEENKKLPGTTLIKINNRAGEFKKAWLLKDGKIIKNFNGKNNYYPKDIKYLTQLEIDNQNYDNEILNLLEFINARLDMQDKILNSYKVSKNFAKITRKI